MPRLEDGFSEAQSDNIPCITSIMIFAFLGQNADFIGAEIRNIKTLKAGREEYGDNAVGYVQVKWENSVCTVRGTITPEHKVTQKPYNVQVQFEKEKQEIISIRCEDCPASRGGCKHGISFVQWLHRRSEDKATTDVKCYWKKSSMSCVGSSVKAIKARDIGDTPLDTAVGYTTGTLFEQVKQHPTNTILGKYFEVANEVKASLHYLCLEFFERYSSGSADQFLTFCCQSMTEEACREIDALTVSQADSALWHELKYGRVTASKFYDVMHSKKADGTVVEFLLGARKLRDSDALMRGRRLEKEVLKEVERKTKMKIRPSGLVLHPKNSIMGASPDGVTDTHCVEVKCPFSEKSVSRFLKKSGDVTSKYKAQIQLQMHFLNKKKGLFCVASETFEEDKQVRIVEVDYDERYCLEGIRKCTTFWSENIFEILKKNFTNNM